MCKSMRIAVASFQHETNTFSPQKTQYQDYVVADGWPGLLLGEQVIEVLAGLNIASEGFIQAAKSQGHTIVPINWCSAEPAGKVTDDTFETIMQLILTGLQQQSPIDALFLDLHGAMVSETYDDGEGEVLRRIRALLGDDFPIVASLDFHANVSADFIDKIDAVAIYRTYPHLDMAETGARCFRLLEQLKNAVTQHKAFIQIPYLIPLSSQHTGSSPVEELFSELAQLELRSGITNIEFAMGFPAADIWDSGASIAVFGSDKAAVDAVCQEFYQTILAAEQNFIDPLISTAQAVEKVRQLKVQVPVIAADVQDNPGAGGSADTTGILKELVALNATKTVVAVLADAKAVTAAQSAGVGARISLALGGHSGVIGLGPFCADFTVEALGTGNFTCTGAMYAGCEVSLGPMALLKVADEKCDVLVIVSSVRYACTDLAVYGHLGVNPLDYDLLVVKSTVHFRAAFEEISPHILMVESPGIHPCQLSELDYKKLRTPLRLGPMGPFYGSGTESVGYE